MRRPGFRDGKLRRIESANLDFIPFFSFSECPAVRQVART
jgi:hypothetical protein